MTEFSRRNLYKCSAFFLGAGLGLAAPMAAMAQDAAEAGKKTSGGVGFETGPSILLPGVALIGSKDAAVNLTASGAYLGADDLHKFNISDVNRALRQVPGVTVREEDGFGLFPNISVRGVNTTRSASLTLMEDGILAAPAPYSAPDAYYSPNIARMNGLEVLKGSSQIKYGPHITSGAINYISTPIPTDNQSYLRLSYGAYNDVIGHLWHGDVHDLGAAGRVGYLVEGFLQRNDGFRTIDAATGFPGSDKTGFNRVEPMVKLFWEPKTAVYNRLEFKYGFTELDADETYLGLRDTDVRADPFRRYAATRFDNIKTRHHRASLRHIVEPLPDLQIATTGYFQYFHRNWSKLNNIVDPAVGAGTIGLGAALSSGAAASTVGVLQGTAAGTLNVRNNNRTYNTYGIQSVATQGFSLGDTAHKLEAGIRYHFDEVDRLQWDDFYTQNAAGAVVGTTQGALGAAGDRGEESQALALHLQDEIRWRKFTLTPGMRLEFVEQEFVNNMRSAGADSSGSGNLNVFGGGASLAYEITTDWNAFFGVHRGFALPGPRDSITGGLSEESSVGYELGTRYTDAENALSAEMVLFRTDYDDLIVNGNIINGGVTENVGEVSSMGAELAVAYDHGRAKDWAVKTPARLAVTLTDAHLVGNASSGSTGSLFSGGRDGSKLPYIPEYQINAEVGLELDKVSTFMSMTYSPSTYTTAANVSSSTTDARIGKTDAYFILDWVLRYQLKPEITLFGGVKNLLNREYIATRHPEGPRTGMPRFFNAGVEMSF
jgi:Fe(3+) dicitrate transport protein